MSEEKKARVIIPPPEIKAVIDKTATYVSKNGQSFEAMIMKVEANNAKFNFLRHMDDPYRPYYQAKLEEAGGKPSEAAKEPVAPVVETVTAQPAKTRENQYQKQLRETIFSGDPDERRATADVRQAPPDQFTINHPVSLANIDADIIKLTAQFVAKNGQRFLQTVTEREQKNPQFDFLKPTHGLFGYFTQLVDSYSKALQPKQDLLLRMQRQLADKTAVLKAAGERYLWDKYQEEEAKKNEGKPEKAKKEEEAEVDWHDFVVVEKIDLYDDEEMKAIETREEAERLRAEQMQKRLQVQIEENQ